MSPHLSPPKARISIKECVERWGNVYSLLMLLSPLSWLDLKKLQSLLSLHPPSHSSHCSSQVIVQTISSIRQSEGAKGCYGEIESKHLQLLISFCKALHRIHPRKQRSPQLWGSFQSVSQRNYNKVFL